LCPNPSASRGHYAEMVPFHLVERSLLYVICVGAVGAFNLVNSILAGITVFLGVFAFGSWVPCSDESRDRP
jgi:hypothetical protein